jgi:sugar phosphate isomerase/epimerase
MLTRRDVLKIAAAAPVTAAFGKIDSTVNGVMLGAQSYSFRDRPLDEAIKGMQEVGIGYCELWSGHVEPKKPRAEIAEWRKTVSMDEFKNVAKKFKDAGIVLYAYNYSFRNEWSDEEIARGFEMAKALGVKRLTASSTVSVAKRVDPYARKARIWVGMHNHSNIKPDEFATPEDFAAARSGMSEYIAINLDIGHFTAANFDPVAYLNNHNKHILTLHIKDRKKNQGPNVPFGEGDTPIKEVLQTLKTKKYKIPAMIEYEYKGADTIAEMKKCMDYCRQAVA